MDLMIVGMAMIVDEFRVLLVGMIDMDEMIILDRACLMEPYD